MMKAMDGFGASVSIFLVMSGFSVDDVGVDAAFNTENDDAQNDADS